MDRVDHYLFVPGVVKTVIRNEAKLTKNVIARRNDEATSSRLYASDEVATLSLAMTSFY